MNNAVLLKLLKGDLQKLSGSEDEYLLFLLKAAEERLSGTMGIRLEESDSEHQLLIVHMAAYLYRKRGGQETAMPLFLRAEINDIKIKQGGVENDL